MSPASVPLLRGSLAIAIATMLLALSHAVMLPAVSVADMCKVRGAIGAPVKAIAPASPFCRVH